MELSRPLLNDKLMTTSAFARNATRLWCPLLGLFLALALAAPASGQLRRNRNKKADPATAPVAAPLQNTEQTAPVPAPSAPTAEAPGDRAAAYYNFAMAHMYSELAQQYGNRGEYLNKAIGHYRAAIKADPNSPFLSEELSDLYIQSGQIRSAVQEQEEALKANPKDVHARRILGRIYSRMLGDPGQNKVNETMLKNALEQYTRIVELEPADVDSWAMLGRLHQIGTNSVEAEKAFQKALELDKENEDALTGLAFVYSGLGDSKRSTELLERVVAKNPSMRSLMSLAQGYEQMRDYKLAAETLRRAVQMSPGNTEVRKFFAQSLLAAENFEEALKQFQELADDDPRDAQPLLQMSRIYRQQHKLKEARAASDKAKAIDPNNLDILFNEVNILDGEGKTTEAVAALKEVLVSSRKSSYSPAEKQNRLWLLERLGGMQRTAQQHQEAIATFRQMTEVDSDQAPRATAQIVETWRQARDYPKALAEADAALKQFPADRTIKLIHASLLADTGKVDEAAKEIRSLLDGKNDRDTYMSLAQVYEKNKNYAEMTKAIDAAEKLSVSDEDKEGVYFARGAMYEKQKKLDLSEAEFRKILKLNPDNAAALNYLGYTFADQGINLPEALVFIQKALAKDPGNGAYLDSLGWVYFKLDRLPEAEAQLKLSIDKVPTDPTVRDHLGDVYAKQGKLKEAISQWQASLQQWKQNSPAEYDSAEVAKVQKKLDSAKVRLSREGRR